MLLDENLVESESGNYQVYDANLSAAAHLHPFYLREHSKRILRGALHNDTKFLADINVMDYSLLCGVCIISSTWSAICFTHLQHCVAR